MKLGAGAVQGRPSGPPAGILIGYARCSTEKQDPTVQRPILRDLGVAEERVYLDHGVTGTNRSRPGLNSALAALREGDTLVVPKLDRLALGFSDARAIGDSLAARGAPLSLGVRSMTPATRWASAFSTSSRRSRFLRSICCGCAPAKEWRSRAPRPTQRQSPKLSPTQRAVLLALHGAGEHSIAELAERFSVSRATVYREIARPGAKQLASGVR
jgi:DNA invertase Pin-like site-specific DNA recombinase